MTTTPDATARARETAANALVVLQGIADDLRVPLWIRQAIGGALTLLSSAGITFAKKAPVGPDLTGEPEGYTTFLLPKEREAIEYAEHRANITDGYTVTLSREHLRTILEAIRYRTPGNSP